MGWCVFRKGVYIYNRMFYDVSNRLDIEVLKSIVLIKSTLLKTQFPQK